MLKQVAEGVWVHRSELLQNNTVVVQGTAGVLLVDPGITESEMADLAADLQKLGQPVVAGFSTHPDWDHVLWHAQFGNAPRYGTVRGAAFMQDLLSKGDWKSQVAEGLPPEIADEVPLELFGQITGLPTGATHVPWDGPKLRVIEHRAHAQGHAALLVEECGVLIAGDMLSDVFVPMLDFSSPAPLDDYLAALQLFRAIADDVIAVVPGHGSVGDADELRARIELDRTYAQTLHDGGVSQDPRVVSPKEGWEWVADIHEGQVQQIAQKNS